MSRLLMNSPAEWVKVHSPSPTRAGGQASGRGNRFMAAGPVGVIYLLPLPSVLTANTRKAQVCFKPSA